MAGSWRQNGLGAAAPAQAADVNAGRQRRAEAERRVEEFLVARMSEGMRGVAYELPPFGVARPKLTLAEIARATIQVRYARGAPAADYLIEAFDDLLFMHLQLNLWRFVAIYRVPAIDGVDMASLAPRLERWQRGAEHAGWLIGWREAIDPANSSYRFVEAYAYVNTARDLLENELDQMFWCTDIVQMTRALMLEAQRCQVRLSPRSAGWTI